MKKILLFLVIVCFSLILVGCESEGSGPDQPVVETDFDDLFNEISNYYKENIPFIITEDIELSESYEDSDAFIDWRSSNEDVLSFTGAVYPNKTTAEEVTLTYAVSLGDNFKEGEIKVVVSPVAIEEIYNRFSKQFSVTITRDYTVKDEFFGLFKVEWVSSNANVFTNEGKYIKPENDTEFEIKYVVKCGEYTSEEKSVKLTAIGKTDLEKIEEITNWIKTEKMLDLYLGEEVTLPNMYEKYNVPITWGSSNSDVVSADGVVTHYVFERYITLTAKYDLGNGTMGTCNFECIVSPLDISKMTEKEIVENFLSAIALNDYKGLKFNGNGSGCNQSYGHLYFYLNEESNIIANMCPTTNKNYTNIDCDVKFVVVHDTGNMSSGATALANSNYCKNGSGGSSTGWHFTTGNDGVYQQIPEGKVAYHAHGGAYDYAEWIKTNVKATWKKPNFSQSEDGYMMINNVKSNFKLPQAGKPIASDGPVWKIGEDGYYYISKMYFSSLNTNSTRGGNANSIGIESAVNNGSDYLLTSRITAKLVAELCMRHNVGLNCVVQHNTTSGKDCPNAMRASNFWFTFKDYVNMEIFAKTYLKDFDFTWIGTGDIDNTGKIKLGTTAKEVKYSVVVTKNGADFLNKSYTTKIN